MSMNVDPSAPFGFGNGILWTPLEPRNWEFTITDPKDVLPSCEAMRALDQAQSFSVEIAMAMEWSNYAKFWITVSTRPNWVMRLTFLDTKSADFGVVYRYKWNFERRILPSDPPKLAYSYEEWARMADMSHYWDTPTDTLIRVRNLADQLIEDYFRLSPVVTKESIERELLIAEKERRDRAFENLSTKEPPRPASADPFAKRSIKFD